MGVLATVVGGAGFVGARLVSRLQADGWEVYVPKKGDPDLLRRSLGVVFYCAGLTADYDSRPFDNVEAHAGLVAELLRADRYERMIYCSSTRLYDGQARAVGDEADPLVFDPADPRQVYDLSKALGENLTLARSGGRGSVARLSNVFDWTAGAPGFLSQWLIAARNARQLKLESSPHIARDYIHLDDAVAALVAMSAAPAQIYNVASGALRTNAEIASLFPPFGRHVSFSDDAKPAPPPVASVARLAALGVRASPVEDRVRAYLETLLA